MNVPAHGSPFKLAALGITLMSAAAVLLAVQGPTPGPSARLMGVLLGTGLVLLTVGALLWLRILAASGGRRAVVRGVLVVAGVIGLVAGCAAWVGNTLLNRFDQQLNEQCARIRRLPDVSARTRGLDQVQADPRSITMEMVWLGPPRQCMALASELESLHTTHRCPRYLSRSITCSCGTDRWPHSWSGQDIPVCDETRRNPDVKDRWVSQPALVPADQAYQGL